MDIQDTTARITAELGALTHQFLAAVSFKQGERPRHFREVEIAAITEAFGNVAHRLSTYEKSGGMHGSEFAARGAISTQFIRTPSARVPVPADETTAWDEQQTRSAARPSGCGA